MKRGVSILVAALALSAPMRAQAPGAPIPPSELDEVIELELTVDAPTVEVERFPEFDGVLHVWAVPADDAAPLDLHLALTDLAAGEPLAEDDDSGGGTTPFVGLDVSPGSELGVAVGSKDGAVGAARLHLVAAPETEATRAAYAAGVDADRRLGELAEAGDPDAARALLRETLARLASVPGAERDDGIARVRWNLGFHGQDLADHEACRAAWAAVLAYRELVLPHDHPELVAARINTGTAALQCGDLRAAAALFRAAVATRERVLAPASRDLAQARKNLAIALRSLGDLDAALGVIERAVAEFRPPVPDDPLLVSCRLELGNQLSHVGRIADSRGVLAPLVAMLEARRPAGDGQLYEARLSFGNCLHDLGDLGAARQIKETLLASVEGILPDDHLDVVEARLNLAATLKSLGDLSGARAHEEACVRAWAVRPPEDFRKVLSLRKNLAGTLVRLGRQEEALALLEGNLADRERLFPWDAPKLAEDREAIAAVLGNMGSLERSREMHQAALAAVRERFPEDHPAVIAIRANLATTLAELGELEAARDLDVVNLEALERTLPEGHPDRIKACQALVDTLHNLGEVEAARARAVEMIDGVRQRVLDALAASPRAAREVQADGLRAMQLAMYVGGRDPELRAPVFELSETMRAVAGEGARALRRAEDPDVAATLDRVRDVRERLARRLVAAGADADAEVARLVRERDRLERDASRALAARGVSVRPIEARALRAALGPGGAAVGYRRLENERRDGQRFFAWVLAPGAPVELLDLGDAAEVEQLVAGWRDAQDAQMTAGLRGVSVAPDAGEADATGSGRRLRERLLDPVLAAVGDGVSRLFVCADDVLFLLPLDALPLRDDGDERVGDRFQIVSEVSFARLLADAGRRSAAPGLLVLGDVSYGPGAKATGGPARAGTRAGVPERFTPLPGTGAEARAVAAVFERVHRTEPVLLTEGDATTEALFDLVPGRPWVHLATHGWFAPSVVTAGSDGTGSRTIGGLEWTGMDARERVHEMAPMLLCGLALAGANAEADRSGVLTAEELCSLDLSACELAVLSACETNVGIRRAGQGIQSLQAALYAAGARSSITSLWKVDDAATRRLMEIFYTNLWEAEMPKHRALWEAKRALRDDGAPVRDWAGWVLTGDPE